MGLAEGVVELRDKCLYLTGIQGSDLIVWPPEAGWGMRGEELVVGAPGWAVGIGDRVKMGGGGYAEGQLLTPFIDGVPPCPGPYFWVSDVEEVIPAR